MLPAALNSCGMSTDHSGVRFELIAVVAKIGVRVHFIVIAVGSRLQSWANTEKGVM